MYTLYTPLHDRYGKPNVPQFEFAATLLDGAGGEEGGGWGGGGGEEGAGSMREAGGVGGGGGTLYMVGDNPLTDIKGANAAGWVSVLVRTGMYQDGDDHTADVVVDTVTEAVDWILEQEGIDA